MNISIKIISVVAVIALLFSCNQKIDQSSMFGGRSHKTKKKGIPKLNKNNDINKMNNIKKKGRPKKHSSLIIENNDENDINN